MVKGIAHCSRSGAVSGGSPLVEDFAKDSLTQAFPVDHGDQIRIQTTSGQRFQNGCRQDLEPEPNQRSQSLAGPESPNTTESQPIDRRKREELDIRLDGSEVAKNLREARQHIAPGRVYPAAAMPEVDGKASVGVIEEDEAILSGDPQELPRELRSSLITVGKTAGDEVSLHRFVDSDVLDEAARDDDIETVSLERNLERVGRMQERAAGPLLPLAMP